jgi:anti-sigma regulatory factor (Ser/Thr protein kinase)
MGLSVRLPGDDPQAAGRARHAVDDLATVVPEDALDSVRLLVSELVTNSFRHTHPGPGDWIDLSISVLDRMLHVEVRDRGEGFDRVAAAPSGDQQSGWGLYLVSRISDRWGAHRQDGTFCVWFDLSLT